MTQSAEEIVKSAYAAILERGDLEGFLEFFSDDGVLIEADSLPYGGHHVGVDAIRQALIHVAQSFSDFMFKPQFFATHGEWVVAYGEFSATARATGKSVAMALAETSHVVDGKIKLIHPIYSDTAEILKALVDG